MYVAPRAWLATLGSEFATTGCLARPATDLLTGLAAPAEFPSPFFALPAIKLSKPSLRRAGDGEAQRGGHQSRTSKLYRPTARDFAAGEPPRHLVEGFLVGEKANLSSVVPLHQQQYSSFPSVRDRARPTCFPTQSRLTDGDEFPMNSLPTSENAVKAKSQNISSEHLGEYSRGQRAWGDQRGAQVTPKTLWRRCGRSRGCSGGGGRLLIKGRSGPRSLLRGRRGLRRRGALGLQRR